MISDLIDNNTLADAAEPSKAKSRLTKKAKPTTKPAKKTARKTKPEGDVLQIRILRFFAL